MNKKILIVLIVLISIIGIYFLRPSSKKTEIDTGNVQGAVQLKEVEKIEIIHFRGTYQCWSCVAIGEYALKTIKEKFSKEYEKGIIVFEEINGELPENQDIVLKYKARGSSLFINAISEGKDHITEDIDVWRLVSNEENFIKYFENKLKEVLNK